MNIKTAFSVESDIREAVADIRQQLGGFEAKMLVFFASSIFDPERAARLMGNAFPDAVTFGCSTAGEIVSGRMLNHSVVVMAFSRDSLNGVKVEVLENITTGNPVDKAFDAFEQHFQTPPAAMDRKKYLGILLIDGLSGAEERVIDRIGDLTNINFVGGSAGDDLKFSATHVYANGKSYTNAAVLAVLEPAGPFSFIKTQSFSPLPQKLLVTKVNEAKREILEFNHKPAAIAYAEAVGTSVADAPNRFMSNPVGLVFEGDPYVLSPQRIMGDSMHFCCGVKEGMELNLLESTDIIADTKKALEAARSELAGISGIITFNCILRTMELEQKGQSDKYGELFAGIPTIGFSTYGEQFIGHLNQTAVMIAFH